MKRNIVLLIPIFLLVAACASPTPQATPQLVNVYVTDAAYPWVSGLYDCASTSAVINLSDPQSADVAIRLGVPDQLTTTAYQISTEDLLVVAHPGSGVDSLTLDQIKALFLGQALNWKEVGGNDLPVQVWTFSSYEDVQGIFSKVVLNGQPVTSLARLATSAQVMQGAIDAIPGSIGILPRRLLEGDGKNVYTATKVPVLAITKTQPEGAIRELIGCLQANH